MTMSTALQNALGGLAAASRGATIVSENIANALTPGYAARNLELTSGTSGGVKVSGIARSVDPTLTASRRSADAAYVHASEVSDFFTRLEGLVGSPDDPSSIPNQIADFENSLTSAASMPESTTRLDLVVSDAKKLAGSINSVAEEVQTIRLEADRNIGGLVERLNTALNDIEDLSTRIRSTRFSGGDPSPLLDQRQSLIDSVNEVIPVNVIPREHDRISLYSEGGLILLEGRAAEFTFATTSSITPHMTLANGLLSGLEVNGQPVRTSGDNSAIQGGRLAAQFEIRDTLSVDAQADLDALARDLIERFQEPGLDSTTTPTAPGLFTDAGSRFDPSNELGLSGRIRLNTSVDPGEGGNSWKLRSGLGATAPGNPGDARQLLAFSNALSASRPMPSPHLGSEDLTSFGAGVALQSKISGKANTVAERLTFATTAQAEATRIEYEKGVDTDTELQKLMQIEQVYAANARVIQVVDDLLETLLRL